MQDNDDEGRKSRKKYIDSFGASIESRVKLYEGEELVEGDFELEDFLTNDEKKCLTEITSCKDVKRAIGFLYFEYQDKHAEFLNILSEDTKKHIKNNLNQFVGKK